mmetsp:Transcript_63406/g.181952  ORF Transcript_63406/g.181952 Transcript_63406/m.181952 type:complete len:235 (-) Transcript_63406:2-706(-)
MLLAVLPLTGELSAVPPLEGTLSLFQIIHVLALVLLAPVASVVLVRPLVDSLPVHPVVYPLAAVLPPVVPSEDAFSFNVVVAELALVDRALGPPEGSAPMLLPVEVAAVVGRLVFPLLNGTAVFQVILPLPLVGRLLRCVGARTVGLTLGPLALVQVPAGISKGPLPLLLPGDQLPVILRAVREGLRDLAVLAASCVRSFLRDVARCNRGIDARQACGSSFLCLGATSRGGAHS